MKITKNKLRKILKESIPEINSNTRLSPREVYALIRIPYEGDVVISGYSIEELKRDAEFFPNSEITAIFYADVIEGEL